MTKKECLLEQIAAGCTGLVELAAQDCDETIREKFSADLRTGRIRLAFKIELDPPSLTCWMCRIGEEPTKLFALAQAAPVFAHSDTTLVN